MAKSVLIFTADDYGAFPEIDDGIIAAVENGWLNSVAMLANGPDIHSSISRIKPFSENGRVDVGLHFTINSGRALSKEMQGNENFTHDGHFRPYFNMNIARMLKKSDRQKNIDDLKKELIAQIEQLTFNNLVVRHLSSHFNVLLFYPEFLEAQNEVLSMEPYRNIKIRSTKITPKASKWLLPLSARFSTLFKGEIDPDEDDKVLMNQKELNEHLDYINTLLETQKQSGKYVPKMPTLLDGFHYHAFGSLGIAKHTKNKKVKKKSIELTEKYREVIEESDQVIEFVFHLADLELMKKNTPQGDKFDELSKKDFIKYFEDKYLGINPKYMDNRIMEFESLSLFGQKYLPSLPTSPWSKF